MTMEDLDALTRKLLTKIREIKIDIWTNSDKTKEDVEKALNITDQIYAELYALKIRLQKQEVLQWQLNFQREGYTIINQRLAHFTNL